MILFPAFRNGQETSTLSVESLSTDILPSVCQRSEVFFSCIRKIVVSLQYEKG